MVAAASHPSRRKPKQQKERRPIHGGGWPVPSSSKFRVAPVKGSGLGVVATARIVPGDLVLAERPLFLVTSDEMSVARYQGRDAEEAMVRAHLDGLTKEETAAFWCLSDCHASEAEKSAFGIWQTNAIATGEDGSTTTSNGLYLLGARFNHSCAPNVNRCWIQELQKEVFYATQEVEPGEQLCIYYIDIKGVRAERQATLEKTFHFTCCCEVCSLQRPEREASDKARQEYQQLDKDIPQLADEPERALQLIFRLLEIIESEMDGDPHLAQRAFYDGFQMALLSGDLELAGDFMQRAYEAKVLAEGEHDGTKRLKAYAEDPTSHPIAREAELGLCQVCDSDWPAASAASPAHTQASLTNEPIERNAKSGGEVEQCNGSMSGAFDIGAMD
mmetsp:Transcript_30185/g.83012  ORF Transcript_30185/g.83012 Transcript_30185/m.83012 type:complete len:388 (+) Transcript_30185:110-1273(+)